MRANQLRLWFAAMAYVLLSALRRIALAGIFFLILSLAAAKLTRVVNRKFALPGMQEF